MDKIFRVNKWFILFCFALIVVWVSLQTVSNMVLEEQARVTAKEIFTWSWADKNWSSSAEILKTAIVSRNKTDAVVKVEAKQSLVNSAGDIPKPEMYNLTVILSFYQLSNHWVLGKVQLL